MNHQFEIEFMRQDGDVITRIPVDPDWGRASGCLQFEGTRQGRLPPRTSGPPADDLRVSPVWEPEAGKPYVGSVRLAMRCDGGEITNTVPTTYFASLARDASGALVDRGLLEAGESFRYRIRATQGTRAPVATAAAAFEVEEVVQELALEPRPLLRALETAVPADADLDAGDMPLLVAPAVLADARAQARDAGDIETGGILIGHLYRDTATPEIFAEVTAQIPAVHTESKPTKLTFTAETWAAANAAVELRRRQEQWLGFWHSHPDWCRLRGCPRERRVECSGALPFLSSEDVHLFGACFGHAHQITLLVSDHSARGWTCAMYGWRRGVVARRAFRVLGDGDK